MAESDVHLSVGSLIPIMNKVKVINPVMQVLGIKLLQSSSNKERYRIILSDVANSTSFAMISLLPNSERLEVYSIIQLRKYLTSPIFTAASGHKKVLLILEMEVVVQGSLIGNAIGGPILLENDESFIISQNHQLSAGSLWLIMDVQEVEEPIILQVLITERLPPHSSLAHTDKELYRLMLSDGLNYTSWGMYNLPANSGGIATYSVIKVTKFLTCIVNCRFSTDGKARKVILIQEAEVIVDSNGAGNETIGDPKSLDQMDYIK